MSASATLLPANAELGLLASSLGPVRAEEFETWPQQPDNPRELLLGWVVPMSPGTFAVGRLLPALCQALLPLVEARDWELSLDALHRLPQPASTVVYPDLAIHCEASVPYLPGTETVTRVPDLVIEILGKETAGRDRAPQGGKFLAYQLSGVREYYYCWPDGREASGFRLENGVYVQLQPEDGYFASQLLGCRLRLVPPSLV
jgi:Uma2 family endonuclease